DLVDRLRGEQIGDVAVIGQDPFLVDDRARIVLAVAEVIRIATVHPEEPVVTALQGSELRRLPQVPLAEQRGSITGFAQQRGQRRDVGGQANGLFVFERERLIEADAQSARFAARDQGYAGGRAHAGARVGLGEQHPLARDGIDARRRELPPVAAQVGITEIVREHENDVRARARGGGTAAPCEAQTERARQRPRQHLPARDDAPGGGSRLSRMLTRLHRLSPPVRNTFLYEYEFTKI